jgi:heptosyltransferase I
MSAVLVVRPSSLGDVVYALALAADIARARPGIAIDWVAEEAFVELPSLTPAIRRTIPVALRRWRGQLLSAATWREAVAFRGAVSAERYDAILDLQEQVKGAMIARLARGVRHGFDRTTIREPAAAWLHDVHHPVPIALHFVSRCRALAAAALGYPVDGPPRWSLRPPARVDAMPDGRYAVAIHATSRIDKLWPEDRWRALLAEFTQAGLAVLLPWGSPAERERSERLARDIPGTLVPPRQSLTALATLLAHADLAVGVDTGLTHLAATLATPTVALFTSTDPVRAGVAITGPHARDLGGNGRVPTLEDARATCGDLLRSLSRR